MPETVPCGLCGDASGVAQPHKARFINTDPPLGVCRCRRCGLLYLNPRLTVDELAELYATHPYYAADNATRGGSRQSFYAAKMARLERWRPQRGTMLAIGCLEGGYALQVAQGRGWQVEAVEASPILAAHARSALNVSVHVARAWDLSHFAGRRFDVIYSHSFEHLLWPRQTLRQCAQLLAADGVLFLEVPQQFFSTMELLKRALFQLGGTRFDGWIQREPRVGFHTYFFTPKTIRALLAAEGFTVLASRTYLPGHPIYLGKGRRRWVQEVMHAAGACVGRGPCIEVVAVPGKPVPDGPGAACR